MAVTCDAAELPVLFLYNIEPDWGADDTQAALLSNRRMAQALEAAGHPVVSASLQDADLAALLARHAQHHPIVFNQCESLPGVPFSEPHVARLLEAAGLAYTGSPSDVLELTGDKAATKRLLDAHHIPTPAWALYETPHAPDWHLFPAIVKTAREHCSLSLSPESVVLDTRELEARIAFILRRYNQPALVEDFIDGREFHVPLWGNGEAHMLPVVEMDFSSFHDVHDRLCTYDSKFDPASRHYTGISSLLPAPLTPEQHRALERLSLDTYRVIGCRDYARLDVRLRDGAFYVLDVNPNADLDSEASIACAAELQGFSYADMMTRLVRLAATRHPRHRRR